MLYLISPFTDPPVANPPHEGVFLIYGVVRRAQNITGSASNEVMAPQMSADKHSQTFLGDSDKRQQG